MNNAGCSLADHALSIWRAGVAAVTPERLVANKIFVDGTRMVLDEYTLELADTRSLIVVGAGKASAAMAEAFQRQVIFPLKSRLPHLEIAGWVNCPEGTFEHSRLAAGSDPEQGIYLHAARPAGVNVPTEQAVLGTQQILQLVRGAKNCDVVICLISGGGSALLVAPRYGISLKDKQAVSSLVAAAGGNIDQLNCVRRSLSLVKGGGLARACRAGRLVSLIISDVIGDPLATIASGPTLLSADSSAAAALQVLDDLQLLEHPDLHRVVQSLRSGILSAQQATPLRGAACDPAAATTEVVHVLLGNNADAVDAAGVRAVELGYRYIMQSARDQEPEVRKVARTAAAAALQLAEQAAIDCWISGGEPTVLLPPNHEGKGGRNQQLALAVMQELLDAGWPQVVQGKQPPRELVFLSGGTDGEDGPTDAAGAWVDYPVWVRSQQLGLDPTEFLLRADAYHFFEACGGLIRTGATGTNVCDLRIALSRPRDG